MGGKLSRGTTESAAAAMASRGEFLVDGFLMRYESEIGDGNGTRPGCLDEPWGVAISKEGYVLVADSGHNRVAVFQQDGRFSHQVGCRVNLHRPCGVCLDSQDRVVVADQFNHRVQVFSFAGGEPLLTIGGHGSEKGRFDIPWDVSCDSQDRILVSDTYNFRTQLFSPAGERLEVNMFSLVENRSWDSGSPWGRCNALMPRGLCFKPDDSAVVTDVNRDRVVVARDFSKFCDRAPLKYPIKRGIGTKSDNGFGLNQHLFARPGGVSMDSTGESYFVVDTHNHRIRKVEHVGMDVALVGDFGERGSGPGQFERPGDVAISTEHRLVAVSDTGNNRVQLFRLVEKDMIGQEVAKKKKKPNGSRIPLLKQLSGKVGAAVLKAAAFMKDKH